MRTTFGMSERLAADPVERRRPAWASSDVPTGDEEHEPREEHDGRTAAPRKRRHQRRECASHRESTSPFTTASSPSHDDERGPDVLGHKVVRGLVVPIPFMLNPRMLRNSPRMFANAGRRRRAPSSVASAPQRRRPVSTPPRSSCPHCLTLNRLEGNGSRGDQRPAIDTFAHSVASDRCDEPHPLDIRQFVDHQDDKVGHEEDEEEHQEHRG